MRKLRYEQKHRWSCAKARPATWRRINFYPFIYSHRKMSPKQSRESKGANGYKAWALARCVTLEGGWMQLHIRYAFAWRIRSSNLAVTLHLVSAILYAHTFRRLDGVTRSYWRCIRGVTDGLGKAGAMAAWQQLYSEVKPFFKSPSCKESTLSPFLEDNAGVKKKRVNNAPYHRFKKKK